MDMDFSPSFSACLWYSAAYSEPSKIKMGGWVDK